MLPTSIPPLGMCPPGPRLRLTTGRPPPPSLQPQPPPVCTLSRLGQCRLLRAARSHRTPPPSRPLPSPWTAPRLHSIWTCPSGFHPAPFRSLPLPPLRTAPALTARWRQFRRHLALRPSQRPLTKTSRTRSRTWAVRPVSLPLTQPLTAIPHRRLSVILPHLSRSLRPPPAPSVGMPCPPFICPRVATPTMCSALCVGLTTARPIVPGTDARTQMPSSRQRAPCAVRALPPILASLFPSPRVRSAPRVCRVAPCAATPWGRATHLLTSHAWVVRFSGQCTASAIKHG